MRWCIAEEFGRARPPLDREIPNYFELIWSDEFEGEDYEGDIPPRAGDIRLKYFDIPFADWVWLINRFDDGQISYDETQFLVKSVTFRTFTDAFRLWEGLMERFVRDEIDAAEVARRMMEGSDSSNGGR